MKVLLSWLLVSILAVFTAQFVGAEDFAEATESETASLCLAAEYRAFGYVEHRVICNDGNQFKAGYKVKHFVLFPVIYNWTKASSRKMARKLETLGMKKASEFNNESIGVNWKVHGNAKILMRRVQTFTPDGEPPEEFDLLCFFEPSNEVVEVSKDNFKRFYGGSLYCNNDENSTFEASVFETSEQLLEALNELGYHELEGFTNVFNLEGVGHYRKFKILGYKSN